MYILPTYSIEPKLVSMHVATVQCVAMTSACENVKWQAIMSEGLVSSSITSAH